MMRYGITRLALGAQPFIEITPQHFGQIRDAKQNLVLTLEIEEKFDIFIENYVEFEETLMGLTLRHMVFNDYALGIAAEKSDGIYSESHEVFEDLILHRKALLEKNRSFKKFAQRYVSGEAADPSPA